jgi:hypothetical protein
MRRGLKIFALVLSSLQFPLFCWGVTPLKLDVKADSTGGKITVFGFTNLPTGTQLLVNVHRKESSYAAGDDKAIVNEGRFHAGPFSSGGGQLIPGRYTVEAIFPIYYIQPAAIQSAVGKNYSNFATPFKIKSSYGTTIEFRMMVAVAGRVDPKRDAEERSRERQNLWKWREDNCRSIPDLAVALSGQPITPEKRKAEIAKCLAEVEADKKKAGLGK